MDTMGGYWGPQVRAVGKVGPVAIGPFGLGVPSWALGHCIV